MNRQQIEEAFKQLAKSQGMYGRLLAWLETLPAVEEDCFYKRLEEQNFKDIVDLVLYMEG